MDPVLTNYDSPYRRLVKDPPGGDVRDTDPAVTVPNRSQNHKQFLKERPIPPGLQYHIKVLNGSGRERRERRRVEVPGRPDRTIKSVGWVEENRSFKRVPRTFR